MKKFLCLFLAAVSIFSLILPAFAADGEQGSQIKTDVDLSKSTISEDFVKVFGGEFKVEDYPYNPLDVQEKNIYLITCVENYVHDKRKSEMYFYLYNPTKKVIDTDSENNKVRASYSRNEDELSYGDYNLTFVNSDSDGVLMKFKVKSFFTDLAFDQSERYYSIAGVELVTQGEPDGTIIDYGVGRDFTFRDNENGFVMQGWQERTVVETEVKHTYYRLHSKDDYNVAFDMQSVYFSVPNEVIDKYGYLKALTAQWEECQVYPFFVVNNSEIAEAVKEYVLKKEQDDPALQFAWDLDYFTSIFLDGTFLTTFNYGYNYKVDGCFHHSVNKDVLIGGSFYEAEGWGDGQVVTIPASKVTAAQNELGWDDYNFQFIDKSNYGENKKYFEIYDTSDPFSFLAPTLNLELRESIVFRNLLDESFKEYPELYAPLHAVSAEDLNLSDKEFSSKYLVHLDDVADIKSRYSNDETLYILNYSITPYRAYNDVFFCEELEVMEDKDFECIVAETTAIRNFDLIEAEFNENGVVTILPFVSNPTNFVPGITAESRKDSKPPLWFVVLIICVVTLIAIKVYKKVRKARRERKFERKFLK